MKGEFEQFPSPAPDFSALDVLRHAICSPRLRPLLFSENSPLCAEIKTICHQGQEISYLYLPPSHNQKKTEIDCLYEHELLRKRVCNILGRAQITTLSELTEKCQVAEPIRGMDQRSRQEVERALDWFFTKIICEAAKNDGVPVVLFFPEKMESGAMFIATPTEKQKTPLPVETETAKIPLPEFEINLSGHPDLTEIDCLPGISFPTRNFLVRADITKISQLLVLTDLEILSVRGISRKRLQQIKTALQEFCQRVNDEHLRSFGKTVVVEPESGRLKEEIHTRYRKVELERVIQTVKNWRIDHPSEVFTLELVGNIFGITKERVRQLIAAYEKQTGEKIRPEKRISLCQLAHQLNTRPAILVKLLRTGKISLGSSETDRFYTRPNYCGKQADLKRVVLSAVDLETIRATLSERLSTEEEMRSLTLYVAHIKKNRALYPSLLNLAHQAGIPWSNTVEQVYRFLCRSKRFHLRRFALARRTETTYPYFYFAHHSQAEEIVDYLKKNFARKTVIKIIFGSKDVPLPNTTQLLHSHDYVSVYNLLSQALGRSITRRLLKPALKIVFVDEQPLAIFKYKQQIKIAKADTSAFLTLVKAKRAEISKRVFSVKVFAGPVDVPIPTTGQFFRKDSDFVSLSVLLRHSLKLRFSPDWLPKILAIIFSEQPPFPVYQLERKRKTRKIRKEDVPLFLAWAKTKREAIEKVLTQRRRVKSIKGFF